MRNWILAVCALPILITGVLIGRAVEQLQQARAEDAPLIVAQAAQKNTAKQNDWVVKIENTVITADEFQREFYVHVFSLPLDGEQKKKYETDEMNKKKFLTNLINEHLVYRKALQEGYDKRREVQDMLKAVTRRTVIQFYLNEKLEPKLKDPTDEQIEAIYNQNKKLFANVDIDVARQQIKLQLLQRQYNDHLDELIDKLKGETRVVRNEEAKL
jgi:hypothetical protein